MALLSEIEMKRRSIVLRDRLDETQLIRCLELRPETAEVWMVIAQGYYQHHPVNITTVVKQTLMDKQTVMRHAQRLANEPVPMITITPRGQDTILKVTDEALFDSRVLTYFSNRYQTLVQNGADLQKLL